jgi:hypothetical protein
MAGYTLEQSRTIIENAGGCSALARKFSVTRQRIEYWYKKGIPSKWQLNHSRFFNRLLNKNKNSHSH